MISDESPSKSCVRLDNVSDLVLVIRDMSKSLNNLLSANFFYNSR